ncbi:hypothetical protein BKA82DRAFT_229913 [Pisolithus tinctorius]|uniref:Uncharacterized protein n=1 Tax=Pisolithus tinctorius Marx 270 TaxID=870435 RepID=A0A0C3P959_PISTI|nr:hypothetical protein BKA82DRAFT_229913 [Pisolithus tinctorius]KIO10045.1 hypothetical protein M404DRAFT_229913 [Pisolithus tinctorius Marx 270]
MDQFRKIFKLSGQDSHEKLLKHSKSMPLRKAKSPKERDGEGSKSVRRTKEPFKTSRLNDVEQMPGVPVTQHQHSYGAGLHGSFGDLLDRFPDPPGPPPRPIRNPLRATSLNNASHVTNATPSRPTAVRYPSLLDQPRGRQHRKFAIHQAIPIPDSNHETNIVVPENVVLGSVIPRRAARDRAQTEAHSYGSDPFQVHHLASHTGSGRGSGLHSRDATIAERMDTGERERARRWIAESPLAPPAYEDSPYNLRPVRFDMQNFKCAKVGLDYHAQLAAGTGRPLDARYDGQYHRLLGPSLPRGLVPEVGSNWSNDVLPRAVCSCTTGRI